jgi:pimeloyl-ACP methyl ester carboxylesterase
VLRIGKAWLDEIEADPQAFDPLAAVKRIACPLLIVHGTDDLTVPLGAAEALAAAAPHAQLEVVEGATHVFNTTNPMKLDRQPSPQAMRLISLIGAFCQRVSA